MWSDSSAAWSQPDGHMCARPREVKGGSARLRRGSTGAEERRLEAPSVNTELSTSTTSVGLVGVGGLTSNIDSISNCLSLPVSTNSFSRSIDELSLSFPELNDRHLTEGFTLTELKTSLLLLKQEISRVLCIRRQHLMLEFNILLYFQSVWNIISHSISMIRSGQTK